MPRFIVASILLVVFSTAPSYAASSSDLALFGKDPGKDKVFACFTRVYDAAHLKSHPKQNVTDMTLLVDSSVDDGDDSATRSYRLEIGVNFRRVSKPFEVSGSCSGAVDDRGMLHCGVDCDGGQIDVRLKDTNAVLVDIPYGARVWDPSQDENSDDPDAGVVPEAAFGVDDKTFLLQRTALDACVSLVNDDDKQALLSAAK